MNTPTNDGGPAFPVPPDQCATTGDPRDGVAIVSAQPGMSLRDYFAAKAMSGMIGEAAFNQGAEDMMHKAGIQTKDFNAFIAHLSYEMADAMLKARDAK